MIGLQIATFLAFVAVILVICLAVISVNKTKTEMLELFLRTQDEAAKAALQLKEDNLQFVAALRESVLEFKAEMLEKMIETKQQKGGAEIIDDTVMEYPDQLRHQFVMNNEEELRPPIPDSILKYQARVDAAVMGEVEKAVDSREGE